MDELSKTRLAGCGHAVPGSPRGRSTRYCPECVPACTVEGCEKVSAARDWCWMHYERWKQHGDPLTVGGKINGFPGEAAPKANVPCAGGCGRLLCRGTGSLPPGQATCLPCRRVARPRPAPRSDCARCSKPLLGRDQVKFCSRTCATAPPVVSPICAGDGCDRSHRPRSRFCSRCEGKRVDPAKLKARWRDKNHRRRAAYRAAFDEVTPEYEQALRTKTRRCALCKVWMTGKPYLPNSKELDHIIPKNPAAGGTHTIGNVRIICRACNGRRPKDGSDYAGPVTLWAMSG